jgi:hypothetical protein
MERASVLAASGRRALIGLGLAAIVAVGAGPVVAAQATQTQPPPQQPAAPAAPQQEADQLKFNIDTPILLMNQVKPDKTADFEAAWTSIRAGLAKIADKPDVKAFSDSLQKLYKVDLGGQGGQAPVVLYIIQLDHPSKTHSYNPVKIIYDTLMGATVITREEADAIYGKLKESVQNIQFWPLTKIG